MAKPNEMPVAEQNHESPEERFRELVAIRDKEKQLQERIAAAETSRLKRMEEVKKEIEAKRKQVMDSTTREIEEMRKKAIQEAGKEANALISKAESEARITSGKSDQNLQKLTEQFKEELLAK
jgi:vacuolar-type H+-ATPase subunit H